MILNWNPGVVHVVDHGSLDVAQEQWSEVAYPCALGSIPSVSSCGA